MAISAARVSSADVSLLFMVELSGSIGNFPDASYLIDFFPLCCRFSSVPKTLRVCKL
jgi:hypothetical protein